MIVRKRSHLRPGLLAAAVLPVLLVMATGCSSSPTKAPARTPGVVHQTPSQGPSSSAPAPAGADLSGTWSGQYSGAYTGTFTLTWRQSGSDLNGTIDLSTSGRSQIHGSVNGSSIRFGTVGSSAITYTGTVSGNSMSGSYQTPGGGGSWSAHKTS